MQYRYDFTHNKKETLYLALYFHEKNNLNSKMIFSTYDDNTLFKAKRTLNTFEK